MIFDIQQFGYGAGIVMVGFISGEICRYLFLAIRGLTKIN